MELYLTIASYVLGFFIVIITVPPILRVAFAKKLFDQNGGRKIHTKVVPPLGGVAIFMGFVLSSIIASNGYAFDAHKAIMGAVLLMFFVGLKDDMMEISAMKKLVVQIIASLMLIYIGNVQFTDLHGILGINSIPEYLGVPFTIFVLVAIMNSFNLIDGIDGLAAGMSIMACVVFGTWFYLAGHYEYAILAFALAGSVSAFFLYNVFGHKNKLFMGDAGSLIIGIVMAVLVIQFNEFNLSSMPPYAIGSSPSVSFAIIILPLIDTIRVMTIRIIKGNSPFSPDNNHLHHRLLKMVPVHFYVTLIIIAGNILIIAFALLMNHKLLDSNLQLLIVIAIGTLFSVTPSIILKIRQTIFEKRTSQMTVD